MVQHLMVQAEGLDVALEVQDHPVHERLEAEEVLRRHRLVQRVRDAEPSKARRACKRHFLTL